MHSQDSDFADSKITEVHAYENGGGWSFTMETGWSFGLAGKYGIEPHVGDTARFWGKGIGYPVRGLAINGAVAYYRTAEEQKADQEAEAKAREAKQRDDFEVKREDHDRRIAALPEPFRRRFERFWAANPDFRWQHEDYELFCCEEAVKLAAAAKAAVGAASPVEWLRAFQAASYEAQRTLAPQMSDGHSGNTFGATVHLAHAYLTEETLVPKIHGVLATLVGCKAYGCTHDEP